MSLDLTRAVRDKKNRIKIKVSCGYSNQQQKWVVTAWTLQEIQHGNKVGWAYLPVQRTWLPAYPGAEEKARLIEDMASLFTTMLDDLGMGYVRVEVKKKEVSDG